MAPSLAVVNKGIKDSKYYFEDGSTVFLVDGYLFKIQLSLLTSHSEVFEDMFKLPKSSKADALGDAEGTSDKNPIAIPQVRADQFRHLLLFLYGVITDPTYRSLVLDATDESAHNIQYFKQYLDIASLSHRFAMESIEAWALEQFKRVMRSGQRLVTLMFDHSDVLEALAYSKLTPHRELENDLRNLAECYFYLPVPTPANAHLQSQDVSRCNNLVKLYKDPLFKKQDPALFGHIFCVVLSAGHQSPLWKNLTRDDRSKLLASQVYLTPLPTTLPITWIRNVNEIATGVPADSRLACFNGCYQRFVNYFNNSFMTRSDLNRDSPLIGVTALSKLATHRQYIWEYFKSAQCKCGTQLLSIVDNKMDALFTELTEKYYDRLD